MLSYKTGENYFYVAIIVNFGLLQASQYFHELIIPEWVQEKYSNSMIKRANLGAKWKETLNCLAL